MPEALHFIWLLYHLFVCIKCRNPSQSWSCLCADHSFNVRSMGHSFTPSHPSHCQCIAVCQGVIFNSDTGRHQFGSGVFNSSSHSGCNSLWFLFMILSRYLFLLLYKDFNFIFNKINWNRLTNWAILPYDKMHSTFFSVYQTQCCLLGMTKQEGGWKLLFKGMKSRTVGRGQLQDEEGIKSVRRKRCHLLTTSAPTDHQSFLVHRESQPPVNFTLPPKISPLS